MDNKIRKRRETEGHPDTLMAAEIMPAMMIEIPGGREW
jgi:hypothetical protein